MWCDSIYDLWSISRHKIRSRPADQNETVATACWRLIRDTETPTKRHSTVFSLRTYVHTCWTVKVVIGSFVIVVEDSWGFSQWHYWIDKVSSITQNMMCSLLSLFSFSYFSRILGNPDVLRGNFCCDSCVHNIHATNIDHINFYRLDGILHCSLYASHQKINFCATSRKECLDVFAAHFIIFSKKLIRWPAGKWK